MPEPNLCRHCFCAMEEGETVCPVCGKKPDAENPEQALPPGTVLSGRYRIGTVLHHNDLLTTYLGWDTEKDRKVQVEEFFPGILKRAEDGRGIMLISAESKTLFRTMASDLHDRWKRLTEINHKAMLKTLVLFSENDTLYRVTEYLRMEPLESYLERQGEMSLTDARQLISPLISLLSQLHNMGLTHCGISPQNIYVDSRKRVVLDGFALPELRTVGNGLHAELYAGYSAPEQYSKALWQGEWTDIYSLGAVLYRMLAGQAPVSAELRGEKNFLSPLAKLRPDLPENVCDGIMRALNIDHKQRYRSMEAFSAALLEESGANTAVFRPEAPTHPIEKPVTGQGRQLSPTMTLLAALLVIWGLWYARPIGVDTLYPELEPDIIEVYLSDFNTYRHEDRRLNLTAGTEEFDDLWSEIQELRFRRSPFNVVVQALPFLEGIVDTYVKYPETDDLDTMSISFAQDNGTDVWRSEHLKFDVDAWSYRDFDHGVTLPLMMKNGHEIGQKMAHELWEQAAE